MGFLPLFQKQLYSKLQQCTFPPVAVKTKSLPWRKINYPTPRKSTMLMNSSHAAEVPAMEKPAHRMDGAMAESFLSDMHHVFRCASQGEPRALEIGDMNKHPTGHSHPLIGDELKIQSDPTIDHQMDTVGDSWYPGQLCTVLENRLSFAAHNDDEQTIAEIRSNPGHFFTSSDLQERYFPFCDDFGPVNLGIVVQFHKFLHGLMCDSRLAGRHIVYYCENDQESVANTIFLLSSYLVLEHGFSPAEAFAPFECIPGIPVVPFRDATFTASTFPLTVRDCLGGLKKAIDHQWLDICNFDLEEYLDLDDPSTGDMHRICPNLFASRAPTQDDPEDVDSEVSAEAQLEHFQRMGITRVLHLNGKQEPSHESIKTMEAAKNIDHLDLFCQESTPSDAEVGAFLHECSRANNEAVVVCCKNGLGKTGTMVGVWIMSEFGFSAREAIAWMRIVRPGAVLGPQQHYLADVEKRLAAGTFPLPHGGHGVAMQN